jgi:glycosyltransferase involved in cell wall biosynthesis
VPDPRLIAGLRDVLAAEQPDVVHAHNWLADSFAPLKPLLGVPLVMTLHDYGLACANKGLVWAGRQCSGPRLGKCLRCAAHHFGVSRGVPIAVGTAAMAPVLRHVVDVFLPVSTAVARASGLTDDGCAVQVIPNFVSPPPATVPLEPELAAQLPTEPFVLFVGSFAPAKGVQVLLEAYRHLQAAPPLVLIDAGQEPIAPLPANVTLLRRWPVHAVWHAWRRSLCGVVPSTWADPCPTVVLEAMTAGRAVVASAVGGIPELVDDGVTGVLTPPGDALALAAALQALLTDDARRVRLGAAAARRAAGYRADVVVPRIETVYRQVQATGGKREVAWRGR